MDATFHSFKEYLSHLRKIASPSQGKPLLPYFVIPEQAVSVVLIGEREREYIHVYHVSHVFMEVELNYPFIKKFAYALVLVSQKLLPCFEAYKVTVLIDQPLKNILQKLDVFGRVLKWTIEHRME